MKQLLVPVVVGCSALLVACGGPIENENIHAAPVEAAPTSAPALEVVTSFDTGTCPSNGCEPGVLITHQCLAANVTGCHILSAGHERCGAGLVPASTSLLASANLGDVRATWCELPPGPAGCDAMTTGGFCETTPEPSRCRSTDTNALAFRPDRFSARSMIYIACEVAPVLQP